MYAFATLSFFARCFLSPFLLFSASLFIPESAMPLNSLGLWARHFSHFPPVSFPTHQYHMWPLYMTSFLSPDFGACHFFGWSPSFYKLLFFLPPDSSVLFFPPPRPPPFLSNDTFLSRLLTVESNVASSAMIFSSAVGAFQIPFFFIISNLFFAASISTSGVTSSPSSWSSCFRGSHALNTLSLAAL